MPVLSVVSTFNDRGILAANRELAKLQAVAKKASDNTAAGFFNASRKMNDMAAETGKIGSSMTQNVTLPMVGLGALAFTAAANYEQSMNLVAAATSAPAADMKKMSDLAMKMGADTVFSANDAAQAMLELAKSGMTPAQIQAGALDSALQLATAGQIGLEAAATTTANAINMFGLQAKDAAAVADAFAGGANASSASVDSLQQALSQVGPGARLAGLTLNDTVGVLAAFADRGIQGSDAGTSLKVMLQRLVPQTKEAAEAMKANGLSFVDAKGNMDDITVVAQKLQDKLGGLSEAEKTAALQSMFGSDATRAASVMMELGSKGTEKYIKATKDREAAERMAEAAMKGSKGSIEEMKGSIETAGITIGQSFAPAVVALADEVTKLANSFSAMTPEQQQMILKFAAAAAAAGPVLRIFSTLTTGGAAVAKGIGSISLAMGANASKAPGWAQSLVGGTKAAAGMVKQLALGTAALVKQGALWVADTAKKAANAAATVAHSAAQVAANVATKAWAASQWLLNAAMSANPIGIIIALIVSLVAGIVVLWQKNEGFRNALIGAWNAIKAAGIAVWNGLVGFIKKFGAAILAIALGPVALAGVLIIKNWDKVKAFLAAVWNGIKTAAENVWNGLLSFFKKWGPWVMAALLGPMGILAKLIIGNWDKIKAGAVTAFTAVVTWVKGVPGKIKAGLGNLSNLLSEAGRKIIQGLWDGMKAIWEKAKKWVTGIAHWIAQNKGPLDKDAKLLEPAGQAIMGGLLRGMQGRFGAVQSFIGDVNGALGGIGATPTIGGPALASAGGSAGGASGGRGPVQFGPIQIVLTAEAANDPTLAAASGKAAGSAFVEEVARMMRAM